MRKIHDAKDTDGKVDVWGTGSAKREFLYVDDLADACLFLMDNYSDKEHINVGTGIEVSIRGLAETLASVINPEVSLQWDPSKPDGAPRKLLDVSRLSAMGWKHSTTLRDGIQQTYDWLLDHYDEARGINAPAQA